jgi:hypothetical protein
MTVCAHLREAGWLTRDRLLRWGAAFATMSLGLLAWDIVTHTTNGVMNLRGEHLGRDFIDFWSAAKMAMSGHAAVAYNQPIFDAFQKALVGPASEFKVYSYPPTMILLCWPLAGLSFVPALALWWGLGWLICAWLLSRMIGWRMAALATTGAPACFNLRPSFPPVAEPTVTDSDRLAVRSGELPQLGSGSKIRLGRHALLPSWPLVMGLFAFAQTLADPAAVLGDPDTYLHIAAGRWMFLHHALPVHDPFSYTKAGALWVVHEWLSEIVLAAVYDVGGWSGLVLLTGACFALSAALLTRLLLRDLEPFSALIAVFLACDVTLAHLLARPHMLALPLLVLWCGALFRARDDDMAPPLGLLPVMTLWANLHGSFMFGLALALYLAGEAVLLPAADMGRLGEVRRWGSFVLSSAIAALITPNGIAGFIEPFRILDMPTLLSSFKEWLSPDFQRFLNLEIWFLGLVALGLATGIRLPPTRLVLVLGLCHMTMQHVRNAEILGFVTPLAVAASLGTEIAERVRTLPSSAVTRGMRYRARPAQPPAAVLSLALAILFSLPLLLSPIRRGDDPVTPARALAAAQRMRLSGPVFNSEPFGGFLIFRGVTTFIDGRIELYGNAFLARYIKAQCDRHRLAVLLDRFHVVWALLSPTDGAALLLDGMPGWRRVYRDRYAVVDVRISKPQR